MPTAAILCADRLERFDKLWIELGCTQQRSHNR